MARELNEEPSAKVSNTYNERKSGTSALLLFSALSFTSWANGGGILGVLGNKFELWNSYNIINYTVSANPNQGNIMPQCRCFSSYHQGQVMPNEECQFFKGWGRKIFTVKLCLIISQLIGQINHEWWVISRMHLQDHPSIVIGVE